MIRRKKKKKMNEPQYNPKLTGIQNFKIAFEKGKLEQKKEELEFLIKKISVNHIIGRFEFLDIIKDRIKQLQKQIGDEK